jgi:hypothetical protein
MNRRDLILAAAATVLPKVAEPVAPDAQEIEDWAEGVVYDDTAGELKFDPERGWVTCL